MLDRNSSSISGPYCLFVCLFVSLFLSFFVKRLTDLHLAVYALLGEYNLRIDHRSFPHDVIQHRYPTADQLSLGRGFYSRRSPIQVLTVPMLYSAIFNYIPAKLGCSY
jgi:hypothetical protein